MRLSSILRVSASLRETFRSVSPSQRHAAEHEVDGAAKAERGPEEIELHGLVHIPDAERHEDRERDHFLQHLELRQRKLGEANAVGGHLKQIFKERDPPACEDCHNQGL